MISITEVSILSVDKSEDNSWAIEGEILFESELSSPFSATYLTDEDEFEEFEMEFDPGTLDKRRLKKMILEAAIEYEKEYF